MSIIHFVSELLPSDVLAAQSFLCFSVTSCIGTSSSIMECMCFYLLLSTLKVIYRISSTACFGLGHGIYAIAQCWTTSGGDSPSGKAQSLLLLLLAHEWSTRLQVHTGCAPSIIMERMAPCSALTLLGGTVQRRRRDNDLASAFQPFLLACSPRESSSQLFFPLCPCP